VILNLVIKKIDQIVIKLFHEHILLQNILLFIRNMPRSRETQRQQIGEPALQPTSMLIETSEESEQIAIGPRLNRPGIKMPEFSSYDFEIWFNIIERTLKRNGITNDEEKFTFAVTAIGPKYYIEIRDIILNIPEGNAYEKLKSKLIKRPKRKKQAVYLSLKKSEIVNHLNFYDTFEISPVTQ